MDDLEDPPVKSRAEIAKERIQKRLEKDKADAEYYNSGKKVAGSLVVVGLLLVVVAFGIMEIDFDFILEKAVEKHEHNIDIEQAQLLSEYQALQAQPGVQQQAGLQQQPNLQAQPGLQPQTNFLPQPGLQPQANFQAQPGLQPQPNLQQQPGFQMQPGVQPIQIGANGEDLAQG
mmetsp:Transcript_8617/g.10011  ORF Transcript_8617/g.10011 Transcript_8617/m.10011 type:complete len:174 (-) Transcript_8617:709-1230(-)|eukprot:CAMPEP_0197854540 /NCGR_PEP_ID=MMETSP1438-20131217/24856_1 /TAXON_ID=1461541 /ORGANISM="Pterosperma sp., Strain CCMP1384" /LENGTH=173 /DNA_ID=CAMNT_0043469311 /DNA_START=241 /DNA_END=762 /DNA_ORIENTATION=+